MARPENLTIDLVGKHVVPRQPEKHQRPFPAPRVLESVYRALRGSVAKKAGEKGPRGFAYVLGGKERGPDAAPDNLIPACVAWYVGERGRLVEQHMLKPAVAKMLNEHLLRPCGKDTLSETGWDSSQTIWRNARKWSQAILRVDHTLLEGTKVLGIKSLGTYF